MICPSGRFSAQPLCTDLSSILYEAWQRVRRYKRRTRERSGFLSVSTSADNPAISHGAAGYIEPALRTALFMSVGGFDLDASRVIPGRCESIEPGIQRWIGQVQNKLEIPDRRALRVVRNDELYFSRSTACQPMSRRQLA